MSRRLRLWSLPLLAAAIVTTTPAPSFADPVVDPAPIGPNQYFSGYVNGQSTNATIRMACFGPVVVGQTGHPMADQTVKVLPVAVPTTNQVGYTGSAANRIGASFGPSSATTAIDLRMWAVAAKIPTTLVLPCYGTGTVTFTPFPDSATARAATVQVTFVGQP